MKSSRTTLAMLVLRCVVGKRKQVLSLLGVSQPKFIWVRNGTACAKFFSNKLLYTGFNVAIAKFEYSVHDQRLEKQKT